MSLELLQPQSRSEHTLSCTHRLEAGFESPALGVAFIDLVTGLVTSGHNWTADKWKKYDRSGQMGESCGPPVFSTKDRSYLQGKAG